MNDVGIIVAPDGGSLQTDKPQYDTRQKHLLIDIEADPPHLDVIDIPGGTALAMTLGVPSYQEEVLFTIRHGLGFQPEVLMYFYVLKFDGSFGDPAVGGYGQDKYFFSGGAGTIADVIMHREDTTKVEIFHYLQDFDGVTWTSPANKYLMRIKYYIFSNPVDRVLASDT